MKTMLYNLTEKIYKNKKLNLGCMVKRYGCAGILLFAMGFFLYWHRTMLRLKRWL